METTLASNFFAMVMFAVATAASPGPTNIVSTMSGAKFGAARSASYALGATIGMVSILAITGSGLNPVITRFPFLEKALAIIGSIYMLCLAYKLARASMTGVEKYKESSPPGVIAGIVAQYTNPKAWIVAITAVSIYVSPSRNYAGALAVFCGIFAVVCFPSVWMWSFIGSSFSKRLGGIKRFNMAMAALLALSIILFIIDFFRAP